MSTEALVTRKEIARVLGVGERTIGRWEKELGLPAHRQFEHSPPPYRVSECAEWHERRGGTRPRPLPARVRALENENRQVRAELEALHAEVRLIRHVLEQLVVLGRRDAEVIETALRLGVGRDR